MGNRQTHLNAHPQSAPVPLRTATDLPESGGPARSDGAALWGQRSAQEAEDAQTGRACQHRRDQSQPARTTLLPCLAPDPATRDDLVEAYQAGATISQLAVEFGIHRTTVAGHLDRQGVPRHCEQTAWDDEIVKHAAELYATGLSLADVAGQFGIDAQTVSNRFRRAGVAVRPRRGWTPRVHSEEEERH
jgi:transposase-like protein